MNAAAGVRSDLESALVSDDKAELKLWLRLLTCSNMIDRQVRGSLREDFGTTLPRFDILSQLDRAPEGLTMTELSGRMMVSNGNLTGLADRLAQEGLVERISEAHDRRTSRLKLTAAGKTSFESMTPVHAAWIENMFGGLSRQEMNQLLALLAKLKNSLGAYARQREFATPSKKVEAQ